MQQIYIVDTTLRDGEQSPGMAFSAREKIKIAKYLDQIGVHQIEAGVPVMGRYEKDVVRAIACMALKARVTTWNCSVWEFEGRPIEFLDYILEKEEETQIQKLQKEKKTIQFAPVETSNGVTIKLP